MTHRVTIATFIRHTSGWNLPKFPLNSPPISIPTKDCDDWGWGSAVLLVEEGGGGGGARWGNSVRHVSVMSGSFLALTSVSTTWGWWDIYRACGADGVRLEGGQTSHTRMCRNFCIFNMRCVWGSVWPSKYFPSWFSVSSFLQIVHQIHSVMDEKVLSVQRGQFLTNPSFRHKH